ncbi:MAG: nucleotidyltransferase domain-containing protein [Bacteroidales bacterium]|nr:nucleotidyltransferase domain-containing protein [Bacteroidales bacterium]
MFASIQRYMATTQIVRAWVFGSFSRLEETPESDLDLLVEYDKAQSPSLLTVIHYRQVIERIIRRDVDLVEKGYLKPFANPTAEHDKYLLYARYNKQSI